MVPHSHPTDGLCAATGLPNVQAGALRPGLLIQTRFKPLPGQEYRIGEIGVVEKDILDDVTRNGEPRVLEVRLAWYWAYRDGELLVETSDGSSVTETTVGY